MSERPPGADMLPGQREEIEMHAESMARTESTAVTAGGSVIPAQPTTDALELTYEHGVELKARSQWAYARMRFLRHRLAVASLLILVGIAIVAIFADKIAPYGLDEQNIFDESNPENPLINLNRHPTVDGFHIFGTDQLGRDYFSRVIFGLQTSLWVALVVALVSTLIGTALGAVAGYYGGHVDNALMRFTDLILTLPGLAVLLVAAQFFAKKPPSIPYGFGRYDIPQPMMIGLILAFLFWTGLARIVRGLFLSLREKEFVEAAKAAGASDIRIILRHMLPNTVGPIVVFMTLVVAVAILTEAALSYLGFGIQPPNASIGKLIADGQQQGVETWWLVTFPGAVIVLVALCFNFVGDGLRDALDPTQKRVRA